MMLLWANLHKSKVLGDDLVIILLVPLVDNYFIMNVYKVYNLLIVHLLLQKTFHYFVESEYLALSSDGD